MSDNNNDYDDNQNEDSQNYDDGNGDQDQEYDSQDGNSQNDGDDGDDNEGNNDEGGDDDGGDNDDDDDDGDENADGPKYIRLRGLPWSATHKEILDFLKNINVVGGTDGIHIMTRRWDGVNSGEAYVVLKSQQDVVAAMKLDNASMGHRYIEVFNASPREAKDAMRKTSSHGMSHVVKLRGLPFAASEQQVEELFNGLDIKPDREGIVFVKDRRGRATGEAFVQFESHEDTEQALGRNRQKIGHRYIEIFRSSTAELKRATGINGRMVPYDLKDRGSNRFGNGNGNGNVKDFGGGNRNNRWGDNGGFGVGANNTLGFNNVPNFGNSGNFGNNGGGNFGNFGGGGGGGMGNFGNFGNNCGGENFGNFGNNNGGNNFGNNAGGGNNGGGGGFNRYSGNSGNFGNDFGDFGNFGNDRDNNNMGGGKNNGGRGDAGFNNFGNFGNCGGNNMGGGFGNNMSSMGGMGGGSNCEYYMIMMRGLPFTSFESDVYKFFEPLRPVKVRIHYNKQNGRHNGTAEVLFEKFDDCQMAMKRHRCKMGARYIELFYNGRKPVKGGSNYSTGGNMGSGGGIGNGNNIGMGGGIPTGIFSRRI